MKKRGKRDRARGERNLRPHNDEEGREGKGSEGEELEIPMHFRSTRVELDEGL